MSSKMRNRRKGFTIIELMLAMGFLSVLLVTIALLVIQITGIYQKGLSLRAVNSQGKQLIDEFTRVVGGSPIVDVTPVPNASGVVDENSVREALAQYFISRNGTHLDSADNVEKTVQYGGVFCTGAYSYVWNNWYAHSRGGNENNLRQRYTIKVNNVAIDEFKIVRVRDANRNICAQANGSAEGLNGVGTMELNTSFPPIELINDDESDLILYDFTVFPATQNSITGQTFYSATFILATMRGGVNIQSSGDFCQVPSENDAGVGSIVGLSSDFNYCAVNKFNFAMRATGYTEGEDQYGERGVDNQ